MAIVVDLYVPTDMTTALTWSGTLTGATSTDITIANGYYTGIFGGSFTYSGDDVSGILNSYTQYDGSALAELITGLSLPASEVETLVENNELQDLLQLALGTGAPTISASSGTNILLGYGGNTTFVVNGGADTINGGSGYNTVVYHGASNQYDFSVASGQLTVSDTVANRDGVQYITNVNYLQFANQTNVVAPTVAFAEVALLYQAALGRLPDPVGLDGWETIFNALPASEQQQLGAYVLSDVSGGYNGSLSIAAGFTNSTEFIQKYGSLTNQQFVTELYANVLDRAPDAAGLNGWLAELNAGVTREHVLVGFGDSQEAINNATMGFTGQSGNHAPWLIIT